MNLRVTKENIVEEQYFTQISMLKQKIDEMQEGTSKILNELSEKVHFYVCGGALRALDMYEEINDIDIYLENVEDINKVLEFFEERHYRIRERKNGILVEKGDIKFDVITSFHGDIREILAEFDFTICMKGIDWKTGYYYEYEDIPREGMKAYNLIFNSNTKYPITSIKRIIKYQANGYYINQIDLMKILLKIRKLDLCNKDVLADQLYFYDGLYATADEKLDKIFDLVIEEEGNKIWGMN